MQPTRQAEEEWSRTPHRLRSAASDAKRELTPEELAEKEVPQSVRAEDLRHHRHARA